ncbi:glycoside hydrolase family 3 N-terminal domain-containing protein [Microbacterium sp. BH-3-3-3]|uniref:glycoside hydrolase family 3 protein n=1 Tax=Microbacterium sp. BH-3-3-3 TaxID=1906742 RepID=UPI00089287FF|nr:glycoside hydrolase family 3 N-terminal domain-containing protein [Microbacterium sp. BH-3-3-3]AOX45874.1 hypothetical protein BJP65_08675 [Microbacterium sp. BH-3-3-3]
MNPSGTTHDRDRASDLVDAMSIEQRIGLLLHPIVILPDDPDASSGFGGPSMRELIVDHGIRFFALGALPDPQTTARIIADLQTLARSSGPRLPIVFSTDPRHSFVQNDGAAHRAAGVSQWPENLGLGAIGDEDLVRRYADIVRRDYLAMGIRMALHPQVDLATEPRWGRQAQSFGSSPAETSRLLEAFLDGLQGSELGPESVAATVKHFPGGGPQLDGEDPHFPYGREQVYPGGNFDAHLEPFRAAIAAGTAAIMPYYGMPVGLVVDGEEIEPVGFAFNRQVITGLLRERLGFDGVVLSDFGLVTDIEIAGKPFPARAWGVEHLSEIERIARLFSAGVDQLGGERDTALVRRAHDEGLLAAADIRRSAIRIVRLMDALGLLDEDVTPSTSVQLPRAGDQELGEQAQARALTVLRNGPDSAPLLPAPATARVHLVGLDEGALPDGWSAADAATADFAVVRTGAPFEHRDHFFLESGMQQGSLDFPQETVDRILELTLTLPVVLVVEMSRPAILRPFTDRVDAILADFGASDRVVLRVLRGEVEAEGRLPFELPRSMAAVAANHSDTPDDTADPLFPAGWRVSLPIAEGVSL